MGGEFQIARIGDSYTAIDPLLTQKEKAGRKEEADLIKRISPIARQNVNLPGRFEFYRQQSVIKIDEMISFLEQKIVWHQPKVTVEVLA